MGAGNVLVLGILGAAVSLWGLWPFWGRPRATGATSGRRPMTDWEKIRVVVGILTFIVTALLTILIVGFVIGVSTGGKWGG